MVAKSKVQIVTPKKQFQRGFVPWMAAYNRATQKATRTVGDKGFLPAIRKQGKRRFPRSKKIETMPKGRYYKSNRAGDPFTPAYTIGPRKGSARFLMSGLLTGERKVARNARNLTIATPEAKRLRGTDGRRATPKNWDEARLGPLITVRKPGRQGFIIASELQATPGGRLRRTTRAFQTSTKSRKGAGRIGVRTKKPGAVVFWLARRARGIKAYRPETTAVKAARAVVKVLPKFLDQEVSRSARSSRS